MYIMLFALYAFEFSYAFASSLSMLLKSLSSWYSSTATILSPLHLVQYSQIATNKDTDPNHPKTNRIMESNGISSSNASRSLHSSINSSTVNFLKKSSDFSRFQSPIV